DKIALYSGNVSQVFPTLTLGGLGVISVISNLLPRETKEMTDAYFSGDIAKAREIQFRLLPIIQTMFLETNPSPIKYAMSLRGLCSPELRLPLSEPRESTKKEIERLGFPIK
ncbi:MAG: dihydrodipicolinate synthase family protein, partial [Clostridia bacterium]|nr:dihydrodipicolinate synthase family protein [Clostridia bacterium]